MEFTPRCPTCRAIVDWKASSFRPFCSERCQLSDLGGWVTERYRIAGAPLEPESDDGESSENGSR